MSRKLVHIVLLLALVLSLGTLSIPSAAAQDAVTLKILLPGDRPAQMDDIITEAEQRMAAEGLNIKLNVVFIPWSDLGNIALQIAAGEEIDLAFTAPWLTMIQDVSQEYYLPLDALLQEYGPNILSARSQLMWDQNRFGGVIYAIPLRGANSGGKSYQVRRDIREALGVEPIQTMEDLEEFLYAVKEAYPDMVPMGSGPDGPAIHFMMHDFDTSIRPAGSQLNYTLYFTNNDGVVHNMFDEPFSKWFEYIDLVAKWRKDGLLPQEMLPTGDSTYSLAAGNIAVSPTNDFGWTTQDLLDVEAVGGTLEWFTFYDQSKQPVRDFGTATTGNYIAVPYTSKHPEQAIQFLNWANVKENYDLLAYGIEGVNWEAVGETEYRPNPDNNYRWYPYAWVWNPTQDRLNADAAPDANDWNRWASNADNFEMNILAEFQLNNANVEAEVAQLNALFDQYFMPLSYGVVDDVEAWWGEYETQAAPLARKVQAEYQNQIDAYLASQ